MKYLSLWRCIAVSAASTLLLSCVPPESDDNPSIELPEAPFDVNISLAVLQEDAMSQFVRQGDVVGAEFCDNCGNGYFAALPFEAPALATMSAERSGSLIEVVPQSSKDATGTGYHRYSFVDENGYTNSAMARYRPVESHPAIRVFHEPAGEDDEHLKFTMLFAEPIVRRSKIEIRYPGNGMEVDDVQLGRNNFISSYLDAVGQQEVTFLIELDEADDEIEGLEFAPVSVVLPGEEGSTVVNFKGWVRDNDGDETSVVDSAPQHYMLEEAGSCPLDQQDRLGSGGDLRFSLEWDNPETNFNLWVKDPCGNIHNQLSAGQQCGSHASSREATEGHEHPSENIVWSADAKEGNYSFAVEHFSGPQSDFSLCVYRDGMVESYRGVAGGGAISEVETVAVNDGDTGDFASAPLTKTEVPDFDYAGEIADPLSVIQFSAEPITVVQTVDGDDLRAELQFQFDFLNLADRCHGQFLEAFITDENGNRTETLVIGNNTYKQDLSEGRGDISLAYIPPSSLVILPVDELVSRNWNIDIPLEQSAKTYDMELSFKIDTDKTGNYDERCLSPESVEEIQGVTLQVDVPGLADVETAEGGPDVRFIYPYVTRPTEDVISSRFRYDRVYVQYESSPATQAPDDVELHINRELYRRDLPYSAEGPLDTEFSGWFVMDGIGIDFKTYYSPIEFRYLYPREFQISTEADSRVAHYRLALSGRADIFAAFSHGQIRAERETLIYHDGWDLFTARASFDENSGVPVPTVIHFADHPELYEASGSAANDIYHAGSDAGDITGGSLSILFTVEATKGFDVLSFSDQVDVENLDYYRNGDDLWIIKSDFFEQEWVQRMVERGENRVVALERPGEFKVKVENYFDDGLGLIDEFRWKNQPYITHEEILAQMTEL